MDDKSCRRCQSDTLSPYFLFISLFTRWTRYRGRAQGGLFSFLRFPTFCVGAHRRGCRIVSQSTQPSHMLTQSDWPTHVCWRVRVCVWGMESFFFCLLLFIPIDDISRLGSHSTSNIIGFRCCIVYTVYPITGELDEKLGEKGEPSCCCWEMRSGGGGIAFSRTVG